MAKRAQHEEQSKLSVEKAIALHLYCNASCLTARQCMEKLLASVKELVKNPDLSIDGMKKAIERWFREGWATLAGGFLQITREGRAKIQKLADEASAPQPVPA